MNVARRAAVALVLGLVAASAWVQSGSVREILGVLRAGGYAIVVRHGATYADQADTDPLNPANVDKQRQLNDEGRADAKAMGEVLPTAGVPIGRSYSSRFQRAVETARLIGGKESTPTTDVTEGGLVVSPNENSCRAHALRALIGAMPDAGTNTLIVTHKPSILDALGKDWVEIKEGEASVFRPAGSGKYTLIGRVQIVDWGPAST